eukprot:g70038.t1
MEEQGQRPRGSAAEPTLKQVGRTELEALLRNQWPEYVAWGKSRTCHTPVLNHDLPRCSDLFVFCQQILPLFKQHSPNLTLLNLVYRVWFLVDRYWWQSEPDAYSQNKSLQQAAKTGLVPSTVWALRRALTLDRATNHQLAWSPAVEIALAVNEGFAELNWCTLYHLQDGTIWLMNRDSQSAGAERGPSFVLLHAEGRLSSRTLGPSPSLANWQQVFSPSVLCRYLLPEAFVTPVTKPFAQPQYPVLNLLWQLQKQGLLLAINYSIVGPASQISLTKDSVLLDPQAGSLELALASLAAHMLLFYHQVSPELVKSLGLGVQAPGGSNLSQCPSFSTEDFELKVLDSTGDRNYTLQLTLGKKSIN